MIVRLQRRLIYRPHREQVVIDAASVPSADVHEVRIRAEDGVWLHGWHAASKAAPLGGDPAQRPLVIFFPGNSGHRGYRRRDVELFTQIGADLLLVDYRGYGENSGRPSEAAIAVDARSIWQHALSELNVPRERIVVLGGSLGGGVATRLAHDLCEQGTAPAGLILRATFTSMADAGKFRYPWLPVRRLLVERFPSIDRIGGITCPLLVVHGARDRVVPIALGRRLYEAARPASLCGIAKRFVELPDSDHNDIIHTGWDVMHTEFSLFLEQVRPGNRPSQLQGEAPS
ncbi:MAG: alpha/beta hydrolase [Planctomycetaceae bacterium]|nr:alpha/beta hydrolase [Planctomycetaceae bacterium]